MTQEYAIEYNWTFELYTMVYENELNMNSCIIVWNRVSPRA